MSGVGGGRALYGPGQGQAQQVRLRVKDGGMRNKGGEGGEGGRRGVGVGLGIRVGVGREVGAGVGGSCHFSGPEQGQAQQVRWRGRGGVGVERGETLTVHGQVHS